MLSRQLPRICFPPRHTRVLHRSGPAFDFESDPIDPIGSYVGDVLAWLLLSYSFPLVMFSTGVIVGLDDDPLRIIWQKISIVRTRSGSAFGLSGRDPVTRLVDRWNGESFVLIITRYVRSL
jgi:hypothetical protein